MSKSNLSKRIILTGTQKPFLNRNESLNIYYNNIRKYRLLTQDETTELFIMYQNGTESEKDYARNKLFNHNARLVTSLARQYCTVNDNLMDLIEEGNIGLLNAIDKFSLDKESSFQKFALFHIRREINLFKVNYSPIVQQTNRSKTDNVLNKIVANFHQKEGRMPTDEELLDAYNVENPNKLIVEKEDMVSVKYVYIDSLSTVTDDFTDCQSYLDYSNQTSSCNDYIYDIEKNYNKEILKKLMIGLTPNEKKAITLFYGLEDGIETSLSVISMHMNCTPERVRQLCQAAIKKMHKKAEQLIYSK